MLLGGDREHSLRLVSVTTTTTVRPTDNNDDDESHDMRYFSWIVFAFIVIEEITEKVAKPKIGAIIFAMISFRFVNCTLWCARTHRT